MLVMRGAIISFMPEEENVEAVCISNYTYGDFDYEADLINGYYSSNPEFIAQVCEGVCNTAESIRNHTFEDKKTVHVPVLEVDETINGGHGGGDEGIVREMYDYFSGEYTGFRAADIDISVKNHIIGFAAETARHTHTVMDVQKVLQEYGF
jgi:hypothetical protein